MTPEERLVVLEGLLAKVRQTANERGLGLPQDLPPGIFRASRAGAAPPQLTAFTEATTGNHRPLALVDAPPAMEPQILHVEPAEPGERDEAIPSGPLIEFESAFDDEVTSDGSPEEIEALVLAKIEAEQDAQTNGAGAPMSPEVPAARPPPSVRPEPAPRPVEQPAISRLAALAPGPPSPLPAKSPLSVRPPVMVAAPSARPDRVSNFPARASAPPSVPLELDDLDGLDFHPPEPLVVPPLPPPIQVPHHESVAPPTEVRDAMPPPPERVAPSMPPPPARVAPSMPPPAEPAALSSLPQPPEMVPLSMRAPPILSEESLLAEAEAASTSAPPPAERDLDTPESASMPGEPPPSYRPPPEPPAMVVAPPEVSDDEPASVPESQRQVRAEERPFDDAFEGISEPPPESGEVESQRYAAKAHESMRAGSLDELAGGGASFPAAVDASSDLHAADERVAADFDESPTPQPSYDVTAEVRAFGSVDVVERPPPARVEVATFQGRVARGRATFGDLLDASLDLGRPKS